MRNQARWLLLSAAELLTMLTFANYSGALPILRHEWGLSAAQAGAIFAAQQLGYTAAVLVLSSLTDLVGVRTIDLVSTRRHARGPHRGASEVARFPALHPPTIVSPTH